MPPKKHAHGVECESTPLPVDLKAEQAEGEREPLPVTVLSGFLGAGKTTLMKHILENQKGMRVAIIVNDMAEMNIDAALIKDGSLRQNEEKLVEMSNGCICCTLREDLLKEVAGLAREGRFDYLLIESSGISEPMPVAETFTFTDEMGQTLSSLARLDTLVTVVDAASILDSLASVQLLHERGWSKEDEDGAERSVAQLLCDQLEFADVVLINKCDLVSDEERKRVRCLVELMNKNAEVIETTRSKVDPAAVLGTGLFSMELAESNDQWLAEAREGEHVPESQEYGISSFTFSATRPFHPRRFQTLVNRLEAGNPPQQRRKKVTDPLHSVIRAKGFTWLTIWNDECAVLSLAGRTFDVAPAGPWDDEPKTDLVIIGIDMDHDAVREEFNKCLLTDNEFAAGPKIWKLYLPDTMDESDQ